MTKPDAAQSAAGAGADDSPVSSILNLGPATEAAFARAGVHSAGELHAIGADEGYRRLLLAGTKPHFIGYYVLVMGLQGRAWNDCKGAEKKALRKRFDALCKEARNSDSGRNLALDLALRDIGVVTKPG